MVLYRCSVYVRVRRVGPLSEVPSVATLDLIYKVRVQLSSGCTLYTAVALRCCLIAFALL
jgi:hypothetical protein